MANPARVGILGGSFDPIHAGHINAGKAALTALELDCVMFVPAGQPWQKEVKAAAEDRFVMTALATISLPKFAVSRLEIDRRGPSYSIDTLGVLRDFYGDGVALFLICGADAAANIETWEGVDLLGRLADLAVVVRRGFDGAVGSKEGLPRSHRVEMEPVDVSSTEIRRRIASGKPVDFLVDPLVAAYIDLKGLYTNRAQLADNEEEAEEDELA